MRPIVAILLTAVALIVEQAARAQDDGPIRNPTEYVPMDSRLPQASCTQYWGLPTPLLGVDWRVFPPPGLLEETPERYSRERREWFPGIVLNPQEMLGPQVFTYDEAGRVSTWNTVSGPVADPTKNRVNASYEYDASGNLTIVTKERWESTSLKDRERRIYTYTAAGLMAGTERHKWNNAWELHERIQCDYDDAGRLEQRIGQACQPTPVENPNPACQDTDSTRYDYDASGRITREYRRTRGSEGTWETPLPVSYTYDEEGALIDEIDAGSREHFEWTYDDHGRLLEETVSSMGSKRRTRYAYQHAGLLTRVASDAWNSDLEAWIEDGEVRYDYGPLLDLSAEQHFTGLSFRWWQRHYRYDARGNLIHGDQDVWADSTWDQVNTEDYYYHDAGFLEEYRLNSYVPGQFDEQRNHVLYSYAVGTGLSDGMEDLSQRVGLEQNHPNPSNRETTVPYTLSQTAHVGLYLFDIMGRRVKTLVSGPQSAGRHEVSFEIADLPSGIYFYRLEAGGTVKTRRMVVVR